MENWLPLVDKRREKASQLMLTPSPGMVELNLIRRMRSRGGYGIDHATAAKIEMRRAVTAVTHTARLRQKRPWIVRRRLVSSCRFLGSMRRHTAGAKKPPPVFERRLKLGSD